MEILAQGKYLRLVKDNWEYMDRVGCTGVVLVAPFLTTPSGDHLILVEQYRPPVKSRVIELPAGLVGDHDSEESFLEAAKRELLEETGYEAGNLEMLCLGPSSAGCSSELARIVMATDLSKVGDGGGVHDEDIVVHVVPINGIHRWLHNATAMVDTKVYTALYFYIQRRIGGKI